MSDETGGIVFFKGHLIAKAAGPGGADIEFGELQDCSFEARDETKEAYGPDSIHELASELVKREVSLRASYLRIKAQGLALLLGGNVGYADNKTTVSVVKDSTPKTFKISLESPSDGSDISMIIYKVRPTNFTLPLALRDYTIPNFECRIMVSDEVDENGKAKIYDIILPGYQSVN